MTQTQEAASWTATALTAIFPETFIFNAMNSGVGLWPWANRSPWRIRNSVNNMGSQKCVFQLSGQPADSVEPGRTSSAEIYAVDKPSAADTDVMFGTEKAASKARVSLYRGK
jgi:hypothetical protein